MMYSKRFAVALKSANGRVLREFNKDKVYLPFGEEYSILLKNMHNRRAVAQISIDGQDIGDGMTFVVPANDSVTIERFVENGNLHAGNRFKFIERTGRIETHRGIDVEDGLVRVTFQLEQEVVRPVVYRDDILRSVNRNQYGRLGSPKLFGSTDLSFTSNSVADMDSVTYSVADVSCSTSAQNEVGITGHGSISEQSFNLSDNFPLEAEKTIFVFQLFGETETNRQIREPVTVKTKCRCRMCGTLNRYDAKFCAECGNSLQIV